MEDSFKLIQDTDPELFESYKKLFPNGLKVVLKDLTNIKALGTANQFSKDTVLFDILKLEQNSIKHKSPFALSVASLMVHEIDHIATMQSWVQGTKTSNMILNSELPLGDSNLETPNLLETNAVKAQKNFLNKLNYTIKAYGHEPIKTSQVKQNMN